MNRMNQAVHDNLQTLALLRDEIRLQAHLFGAELRDQWDECESRWNRYQQNLLDMGEAAAQSRPDIRAATERLEAALTQAYTRLRAAVRSRGTLA